MEHENYGRREVFKKEFMDLERTSYLDFFYLEDDKWEEFLVLYLASIEETLKQERQKIDEKMLDEVFELFVEAGIEQEQLNDQFRDKLREFFVKESRWLTVEAIVGVMRNFGTAERQELYEKITQDLYI